MRRLLALSSCAVLLLGAGCFFSPRGYRYERYSTAAPAPPARRSADTSPNSDTDTDRPPVDDSSEQLTLRQAIELAVSRNPDIQMALRRIEQAEASVNESLSAFLPHVSVGTGYLRADSPSTFLFKQIDARSLQPGTDFNRPGEAGFFETGVQVRYTLFRGGRSLLERWMAQTGRSIRELDEQVVRNALVASVIQTYYNVLAARANARTAGASVDTVRAELEETRVKYENGRALKSDVLSLEVRLAEARDQAIRAENGQRLARAALANVLGGDLEESIELVDSTGAPPGPTEEGLDLDSALEEAFNGRPELLRARRVVENAAMELASQRGAFLPRVEARYRAYWTDEHMSYDAERTNWVAGIDLTWNLFEGGARSHRVRRARAELEEMLQADRKAVLAVELDVKTAFLQLNEARSRLEVATASVAQAEETLDLVRKQYEGGSATITRYLEAELMLTRARLREINARFDLKKATADVDRAMGRFTPGPKEVEPR